MTIRPDEVETFLDYLEEYIKAVVQNANDPSVESYISFTKQKETLKEFLTQTFNIKENEPEPTKPVIEELLCPECESKMIARANRTTGEKFWGCVKYPDCRGTRDSEGKSKYDKQREKGEPKPLDEMFRFRRG